MIPISWFGPIFAPSHLGTPIFIWWANHWFGQSVAPLARFHQAADLRCHGRQERTGQNYPCVYFVLSTSIDTHNAHETYQSFRLRSCGSWARKGGRPEHALHRPLLYNGKQLVIRRGWMLPRRLPNQSRPYRCEQRSWGVGVWWVRA